MPLHDPAPTPAEARDPASERHNARLGLLLFAVYLIGYAAFVAVSAFAPSRMSEPLFGVNAAVAAGFGLIAAAVLLAVVYAMLCRKPGGGRS